tara:strand:- start:31127 stop:31942 length:816 start_codon:yes stop_codon:yes gene_type:complete
MIRILLILLILLFYYNSSKATRIENDSILRVSGQIVTKTSVPIPLAHILVKGKRSGQICDSLGIFHLQVERLDTLIISALGFKTKEWAVPFISDTTLPLFYRIPLEKTAYLINEVNVFAFGTWDDFKADFLKLKIKNDYEINSQITKELASFNTRPPNIIPPQYRATIEDPNIWDAIRAPGLFLFTKLNRKEKSKRKVSKMMRSEWKAKQYTRYYASHIVSAHTGLKGQALEDFMAYCGPKLEITKISSRYDIAEQIVMNYKWYIELNKAK